VVEWRRRRRRRREGKRKHLEEVVPRVVDEGVEVHHRRLRLLPNETEMKTRME